MDVGDPGQAWRADGFAVLPGFLAGGELAPAVAELDLMFPSADGFHDRTDPRYRRYLGDEFAGIDAFPFASTELSLLAVHDRLAGLAEMLLADDDIRIYSAEAWAKYTGAADYDQPMHRDYLGHTVLVPTAAPAYQQLEMFVYLVDVPGELGPPHFVSRARTAGLPAKPNWYPRADGFDAEGGFVATGGSPELYAAEVSAAGPAGTVVAWGPGTFHRGTALTAPRGARYTLHLSFRPATAEWGHRHAWADRSHDPAWYRFVARASPRQLLLFGFPPPGHPFWTPETVSGMGQRYPGPDWSAWLAGPRS
jgi:Phytanoyl-CoA dioxygenase (PhyH)